MLILGCGFLNIQHPPPLFTRRSHACTTRVTLVLGWVGWYARSKWQHFVKGERWWWLDDGVSETDQRCPSACRSARARISAAQIRNKMRAQRFRLRLNCIQQANEQPYVATNIRTHIAIHLYICREMCVRECACVGVCTIQRTEYTLPNKLSDMFVHTRNTCVCAVL